MSVNRAKGTRDFLPEQMHDRLFVIDTIASVGADAVELVGWITKVLLLVYGVVIGLQVLTTRWYYLRIGYCRVECFVRIRVVSAV